MKRKLVALTVGVGLSILLYTWLGGAYFALIYWDIQTPLLTIIFLIAPLVLMPLIIGMVVGYLAWEWGWLLAALVDGLRWALVFPFTPILLPLLDRVLATRLSFELGLEPGRWSLDVTRMLGDLGWSAFLGALGGLVGEILFFRGSGRQVADAFELRQGDVEGHPPPSFLKWYFSSSPSAVIKIPIFLLFIGLTLWTLVADFRVILWFLFAPPGGVGLLGFLHWLGLLLVPLPLVIFYEIWSPQRRLSKSLRWGLTVFVIPAWLVADLLLVTIGRLLGGGS
jgi:hypothetical protein